MLIITIILMVFLLALLFSLALARASKRGDQEPDAFTRYRRRRRGSDEDR